MKTNLKTALEKVWIAILLMAPGYALSHLYYSEILGLIATIGFAAIFLMAIFTGSFYKTSFHIYKEFFYKEKEITAKYSELVDQQQNLLHGEFMAYVDVLTDQCGMSKFVFTQADDKKLILKIGDDDIMVPVDLELGDLRLAIVRAKESWERQKSGTS